MSRIVVIHGIHAAEGQSNVWRLKPYLELQGHGVEVFEYGYARALVKIERERVQAAAIAARVARADEDGWKRWIEGMK